ncbi:MAG: hypothetical protein NTY99_00360 [DPANN group archaeon]|nr:hypothetical protein [DPANN group archaeon]
MKTINPKKFAAQKVERLKKDVYAIIWIVMIASFIIMTLFFKSYLKDMIVISILTIIFWYLEPLLFGATGKTVTTFLSGGKHVPRWKRFPLFFLIIIFMDILWNGIQFSIERIFPTQSINLVFVALWVGFLFLLWVYKFSKE